MSPAVGQTSPAGKPQDSYDSNIWQKQCKEQRQVRKTFTCPPADGSGTRAPLLGWKLLLFQEFVVLRSCKGMKQRHVELHAKAGHIQEGQQKRLHV